MDKLVKSPYIETCKPFDGCIIHHKSNLEDNDYITDQGIHEIDKMPYWYSENSIGLYNKDWIMVNDLKFDSGFDLSYSLDDTEGNSRAFYNASHNFKQSRL